VKIKFPNTEQIVAHIDISMCIIGLNRKWLLFNIAEVNELCDLTGQAL